jgi:Phytanoyl-CoA dioxygenase (PhyH)
MSLTKKILMQVKYFDRCIGYPLSQMRELYKRAKLHKSYREWKGQRRLESTVYTPDPPIEELQTNGYVVLRNYFSNTLMDVLAQELNYNIDMLNVNRVIDMRGRITGDLPKYLSPHELGAGQETFRFMTNYVSVSQPMLASDNVVDVVFDEGLLRIANQYLGCYAGVGSVNWRKSYANEFSSMDNQMFHVDKNCVVPLKVLIYLNDVNIDGGPFVYVKGSNKKKFSGWLKNHRYTDAEIASHYTPSDIINLVGKKGDVIIADTSGIHKGLHPKHSDRHILIVGLNAQPDFAGSGGKFKLSSEAFYKLSEKQRRAADFLVV